MKNRILIMISVMILITMVGCSQETVKVISSTTKQPTTVVTTTTNTTKPITTKAKPSTTNIATTTSSMTASTTKQQTTQHTTTKPKSTTQKATTKKPKPTTIKKVTTTKKETTIESCRNKNDHFAPCGKVGKWYKSRTDFQEEYFRITNEWNAKLDNEEIDWDTYVANCPQGYECWSCGMCGQWTGNYK